ncbi:hypothetical protein ACFWOB_44795 [Streptomyces sp. NPDC058420]|uniref:hypothetical protein n=1 Tax=Streptomyces sp. NPDC058420 TaxID=3346489 RepID=UPI003658C0C1
MVFKLVESVRARRHGITAPRPVALVRAGARFEKGRLGDLAQGFAPVSTGP